MQFWVCQPTALARARHSLLLPSAVTASAESVWSVHIEAVNELKQLRLGLGVRPEH
jgi:hypothetical protein